MSNVDYKLVADVHHKNKEFNVGDHIMVRVRPERYTKHSFKNLHARAIGPFPILRKLGPNGYALDLSNHMNISHVFNVEDLKLYQGTFEPHVSHDGVSAGSTARPPPLPTQPIDQIESILDDQINASTDGGFRRFLIHWKERPQSDDTWVFKNDIRELAPNLLELFYESNSPESSSFQPEEYNTGPSRYLPERWDQSYYRHRFKH
ncbi:Chromo domain-containing protein [Cephalotus follicularis]|uniref:Chromo domain-containing protein n=1 Tax=Cephalotus follicularis TaxID=3775 RepID=A0A1Q3C502_CEPFO|nr:Chromo domain-containing protein [Cephalotus follicularis]